MKISRLLIAVGLSSLLASCATVQSDSDTIIVTKAMMQIAPDSVAAFKEVAARTVAHTLTEEGCLNYAFYQDASDSTKFFLYEEYTSQEALDYHLARPYLVEFRTIRKDMLIGDIPYVVYTSKMKYDTIINGQKSEYKLDPIE